MGFFLFWSYADDDSAIRGFAVLGDGGKRNEESSVRSVDVTDALGESADLVGERGFPSRFVGCLKEVFVLEQAAGRFVED